MKKLILILSLSQAFVLFAQQKQTTNTTMPKIGAYPDKDVIVYQNGIALGDLETATYALHNIIAANPNGSIYKDTLAMVYLQRGFYRQAKLLTGILYQDNQNDFRTEILAICAKQLGDATTAIDLYKKLYNSNKNINFAFEQLQLEYSIKRLAEAKLSAETLLVTISPDVKTKLTVARADNKSAQEVSLKAGIYYILGNIYFDMNDKVQAQQQFEKAISIQPDYELAQIALNFLIKKEENSNGESSKKKK